MNVVIVGNHDLDVSRSIASKLAALMVVMKDENEREMEMWGNGNKISIRARNGGTTASSSVEALAITLATAIGLDTYWVRPLGPSRTDVYNRDYSLIGSADKVMAFFRCNRVMEGGTGHVVHAALVKGIPVEAWVMDESGTLEPIGCDDGLEVGYEGSRWMQLRYLEWQAQEVEAVLQQQLVRTTATPIGTYIGTITSGSIGTSGGKISLGPGKVWLGGPARSTPQF